MQFFKLWVCLWAALTLQAAATEVPSELKDVGITEHSGASVLAQNPVYRDESGATVHLSQYFQKGKPVVIVLAYYECPNLCTFVLNGLTTTLKRLHKQFGWAPGKEFEIVTVSIDPRETPELATQKKNAYLANLGIPSVAAGWHFLTGTEAEIHKLSNAVGFNFKFDKADKQYAHSAAIFAITPDGRVSRYLYGIEYDAKDLKLALLEASNGKIGTVVDRFLLFCYRYDPKTRKYSVALTQVMRAGGAGTVVVFGGYLAVFWRRQRRISFLEESKNV